MICKPKHPLVYSCSGASSAAQMANHIAVRLDRMRVAEMSCIAGVGGDVKPLVHVAKSGRPIIAVDGCPLKCAAHSLNRHGIEADRHYDLSKMGVLKVLHDDFDPKEAEHLTKLIAGDAERLRSGRKPAGKGDRHAANSPSQGDAPATNHELQNQ